jgi:hypothetical protein
MSHTIVDLFKRSLQVFAETDDARRRATIDEIYTDDCVFYDPNSGAHRGRDQIDKIAGVISASHPGFEYQPIVEPDMSGNSGRIQWVSGHPGNTPKYAGTDFFIVRDNRIAAIYLFWDPLPKR